MEYLGVVAVAFEGHFGIPRSEQVQYKSKPPRTKNRLGKKNAQEI